MSVAVLVLGDLGRSPRMQYHAVSLADAGRQVDFIGYLESIAPSCVPSKEHFRALRAYCAGRAILGVSDMGPNQGYLADLLPVLDPTLQDLAANAHSCAGNPPSIPTLIVAQWACRFRNSKLVIDWHNLGYTILELKTGKRSLMLRLAKWIEESYGRSAHGHLFVTQAMQEFLVQNWRILGQQSVLYDRPPPFFKRLHGNEKTEFIRDWKREFAGLEDFNASKDCLVVSSTSWTADEDFGILLDALCQVEDVLSNEGAEHDKGAAYPRHIYMVITGKGPLRHFYENEIERCGFRYIRVLTCWLRAADYPKLLGSADFGISLHTSSSGLDLPMKVVDMFGCDLPVCAFNFACLSELVTPSVGQTFEASEELARQFLAFARNVELRQRLSTNIHDRFANARWDKQWREHAWPLFAL